MTCCRLAIDFVPERSSYSATWHKSHHYDANDYGNVGIVCWVQQFLNKYAKRKRQKPNNIFFFLLFGVCSQANTITQSRDKLCKTRKKNHRDFVWPFNIRILSLSLFVSLQSKRTHKHTNVGVLCVYVCVCDVCCLCVMCVVCVWCVVCVCCLCVLFVCVVCVWCVVCVCVCVCMCCGVCVCVLVCVCVYE